VDEVGMSVKRVGWFWVWRCEEKFGLEKWVKEVSCGDWSTGLGKAHTRRV
jgi:hypothetical protein